MGMSKEELEAFKAKVKANTRVFTGNDLVEEIKNFTEEDKAEVNDMVRDMNTANGVPDTVYTDTDPEKEVEYNPALWKRYWDTIPMYKAYEKKTKGSKKEIFESPEVFRLPIVKTVFVREGTGIRIDGIKGWDALPNLGALIPEHKKSLEDYCKSTRLLEHGFRLVVGEPDKDIYYGTNILPVDGDVKEKGWSYQMQMLYGCGYSMNTRPDERITKPILPSMLFCYLEITDYEKASKFLSTFTGVPCMVLADAESYANDYRIKQVVDTANKYCLYWQTFNKTFSSKSKNSYEDMLLDDID